MKIQPLTSNVLLEVVKSEDEKTKSGILIPDSAKEKKPPVIAKIIAVGPEIDPLLHQLSVGDKVIFAEYGFDPIEVDGLKYQIGSAEKILAIIR